MDEDLRRLLGNLQNVLTELLCSSERFTCAIGEVEQAGYEIQFSVDSVVVGDSQSAMRSQSTANKPPRFDGTLKLTADDECFLRSFSIGT
jgi:hypothetical protein